MMSVLNLAVDVTGGIASLNERHVSRKLRSSFALGGAARVAAFPVAHDV
jgi:hypothetical protein